MSSNIQQPLRKRASRINHPPQPYVGDLPTQSLPTEPLPQRQHVPNKSRIVRTSDDAVFKDKASLTFSSLHSRKTVAFLFRVVIFLALSITIFLIKNQTQYQGHAAGTGNVYYANPGEDLTAKASVLQPGDTLILNDGTYSNQTMYVNNIHGTATAPITIKAANDGKAIIDQGGSGATTPNDAFRIENSSYITAQGFIARDAYGTDVLVQNSSNITIQRISAYGAGVNNTTWFEYNFGVQNGSSNVLVEDSAAYGQDARYDFIAFHASYVTFRRDFAMNPSTQVVSTAPRNDFGNYGSNNSLFENVIGISAIPTSSDNNYYSGLWQDSADSSYPDDNGKFFGDMFYNDCQGLPMADTSIGQNEVIKDTYISVPDNTSCDTLTSKYPGNSGGIEWDNPDNGSIANTTIVGSPYGFGRSSTSTSVNITNSVFLNNSTAIVNGDPGHSYVDFFGNGSNGVTLNSTDKTTSPGYDTTTYGRGAYLFVSPTSPLKGAGSNGSDIGANILYEYVNGQLSTTPLWPWPMEDRIMAEKGISVTWSAKGGIWNTLNGVYANVTIAPSPTYASTPTPTPISSDTLPPTVTILSPVNGGTVSRRSKVTITASASEGVTHVSYSVNGSLLCTSTTSPYRCSWFVPGKPNATYTITATAYDVAGYTRTNSVSVTAK